MLKATILALAVVLLTTTAEAAKLPSKFVGDWCPIKSQSSTYERGRRCRDTDMWKTVHVNGYRGHEEDCRVLNVAVVGSGNYQVKFRCRGEGETWIANHRMSLDNKGQLIMR